MRARLDGAGGEDHACKTKMTEWPARGSNKFPDFTVHKLYKFPNPRFGHIAGFRVLFGLNAPRASKLMDLPVYNFRWRLRPGRAHFPTPKKELGESDRHYRTGSLVAFFLEIVATIGYMRELMERPLERLSIKSSLSGRFLGGLFP